MVSQLRALSGASSPPTKIRRHPLLHTIEGTVQVFTSPHRSFFTNVMVQALRAAEQGLPVLIVQFLKGGIGQGPTQPTQMGQNLTWLRCDYPGCISGPEVPAEAEVALLDLWQHTQTAVEQGKYGLVVLDELSLALEFGLLTENEVLIFLKERPPQIEVVLTGPQMPDSLIAIADQVTEFRRNYLL
ncbi:P-loop NTPase family protein [Romeria aff. gracilis LEGE 07310]|uniref:P-loop NTPase family protein n=1 Tax=Vasconcelosia minhoensis LEGE 07310 TaxID=915328 RepID=A0A8J7AN61_9CYAN|nr:P-loop NTPase family protein [Romeria gracilis]MBE9077401.1 P-loop NTPase family protein [Romeria aff. gracilis LEGE 07310]